MQGTRWCLNKNSGIAHALYARPHTRQLQIHHTHRYNSSNKQQQKLEKFDLLALVHEDHRAPYLHAWKIFSRCFSLRTDWGAAVLCKDRCLSSHEKESYHLSCTKYNNLKLIPPIKAARKQACQGRQSQRGEWLRFKPLHGMKKKWGASWFSSFAVPLCGFRDAKRSI